MVGVLTRAGRRECGKHGTHSAAEAVEQPERNQFGN